MWWIPGGNSSRTTRSTRLWISESLTSLQRIRVMSSGITRAAIVLLTVLTASLARADDRTICPDRPGRGTSPCTVDAGHGQFELGLFDDSFQRRSGVTTNAGNAGALLAKWGLSERIDIEAGMALY